MMHTRYIIRLTVGGNAGGFFFGAILYSWREGFELFAMFFVARVMFADFGPKFGRMIHMIEVGEFVKYNIITQGLWHLHKADIERNSTSR